MLRRYGWPGNIRELQNVIDSAVITAQAGRLRFDLPIADRNTGPAGQTAELGSSRGDTKWRERNDRFIRGGNCGAAAGHQLSTAIGIG